MKHLKAILEDMPEDAEIKAFTRRGETWGIDHLTLSNEHDTFVTPETRRTYVTIWLD